jgi:hypothetical protein
MTIYQNMHSQAFVHSSLVECLARGSLARCARILPTLDFLTEQSTRYSVSAPTQKIIIMVSGTGSKNIFDPVRYRTDLEF